MVSSSSPGHAISRTLDDKTVYYLERWLLEKDTQTIWNVLSNSFHPVYLAQIDN